MNVASCHFDSRQRKGLTVLELLVTIAIIGVLVALTLPAIHSARESARDMQCRNNLKQIGVAIHSYHELHRRLPIGWRRDANHRTAFGWASQILPLLEQSSLSSKIAFQDAADAVTNAAARAIVPSVFRCPSDYATPIFTIFSEHPDEGHEDSDSSTPANFVARPLIEVPAANYLGVYGTTDPDESPDVIGDGVFVQDRSFRFAALLRGLSNTVIIGE